MILQSVHGGLPMSRKGCTASTRLSHFQAIRLLIEIPRPTVRAGPQVIGTTWQDAILRELGSMQSYSRWRKDLSNQGLRLHWRRPKSKGRSEYLRGSLLVRGREDHSQIVQLLLDII